VPSYAGPNPPHRSGDVAGTLRLLAYLALALVLIVLDHRSAWLDRARAQATLLVQPLWMVAGWPGHLAEKVHNDASTLTRLTAENARLRNEALVNNARLARLQAVSAENARLRELMGAAEQGGLDVQLAPILDIDLDPTRQRLVVDAGSSDGVHVGQSVIDAGGLIDSFRAAVGGSQPGGRRRALFASSEQRAWNGHERRRDFICAAGHGTAKPRECVYAGKSQWAGGPIFRAG
jgi:rod shape-determining protein MreC